ncbi:PREDICTED: acylsugar acyltransferase 3-like [Nicotiana attenuata]|uniref:Acylsugar acyltransferase 3 n=1 Tax=Nicotiana attenuata TaxID=49451 RepID=A0A1J6I4M9_NICAT|nr:PREDICTED: acylsugar acyltransferase 3-like [Nicotiana attenuata]OIS99435.1 acylsugar acyltransferase 3 [Nicotiana attenuata]
MVGLSTIISKKIVKPLSPTPSTQRWHKLSLLDQGIGNFYMGLVLFYPKHQVDTFQIEPKQLSTLLENSLSKAITYYYPWAGSLRGNATIDCDDTGAEFLEVEVNCPMDKVLYHQDSSIKNIAFPQGVPLRNAADGACLIVSQLSHFECGGIAISVCLSHKVGDARSALFFVRDWAVLTRDPNAELVCPPYFVQDSLIPSPSDGPLAFPVIVSKPEERIELEKRFYLSASKIRALKDLVAAESGVENPTTTEVVSALVYKSAAMFNLGSSHEQSRLILLSDIRKEISHSVPSTSIGNILTVFSTPIYNNKEDLKVSTLVADIRKSKHELSSRDNFKENEWASGILHAYNTGDGTYRQSNCDVYRCSSASNIPFQDLDFGWGKPIRATMPSSPFSKMFYMMSTHDRGIEVIINLNEQQMSAFENDKDLLEFATPAHVED